MLLRALAADVIINTNLPSGVVDPNKGLAGMVGDAYTYLVSISGGIAFLVIVYAGIQWALSQGNAGKISDAKDRIWQALYGILILFGAYLLLSMVNPSLTYLQMPTLTPITLPSSTALYSATGTIAYKCGDINGALNAPCPDPTQTCTNLGGALQQAKYSCVAQSSFDCGNPKNHPGKCEKGSCMRCDNFSDIKSATDTRLCYSCQ
jgi:hypothetical protein